MGALKDEVNAGTVRWLAGRLTAADPAFAAAAFEDAATAGLDGLELEQRVAHVARALAKHLPGAFPDAAALVDAALVGQDGDMWRVWPVCDWVALAGRAHPREALALLARLTSMASAEFAVRPFLDDDPATVREVLTRWTHDPDEHVRRLVSEGTRPRLPWAPRSAVLGRAPGWAVPLLDALRDDPSPFVRRSVANHLNDLCKVDPDLALATAARWRAEGGTHVDAVLRHGLRTLVKKGEPTALALLGVDAAAALAVDALAVRTPEVVLDGALCFDVTVSSADAAEQRVVLDYRIWFVRARGAPAPKAFKLRTFTLAPGQQRTITRRHPIVPISTRRYHPGTHRLDVQVNGTVRATATFEVAVPGRS